MDFGLLGSVLFSRLPATQLPDYFVKQNQNSVYSQYKDLVPKILKDDSDDGMELDYDYKQQQEIQETTRHTKSHLENILNRLLSVAQPSDSKFVKYKPSQQSQAFPDRVIRTLDMPLDPPKFKHKRLPKASGSPPVPVLHSPPHPPTLKDQQDWKIPPCISTRKNPKGYTIPLDKRLAADGRGLLEVTINDNFAQLSEALYVSEQKAREEVSMRAKLQKELAMKDKESKEQELRALAKRARSERRTSAHPGATCFPVVKEAIMLDDGDMEDREKRIEREQIREERRRQRRSEAKDAGVMAKKSKITRDTDRDITEKVALGMASAYSGLGCGEEVVYDQRLFNQDMGLGSGFVTDDQYTVYDNKGLFNAQPTLSTLYRPKRDMDADLYMDRADDRLQKIMKTDRFIPDKAFAGTSEKAGPRHRPVEFETEAEEADPFGLDQFLTEVKKGKQGMDEVGTEGMKASAGSSLRDGLYASGRTCIRI